MQISELPTERPIFEAVEEWRAARDDLQRAVYSTFDGVLVRYVAQIEPDSLLGKLIDAELPSVDFDSWYNEMKATMGGMVGSATLIWPIRRAERVCLQRQLLIRMSDGRISLVELGHYFFHSSHLNDHIRDVVAQVIEPFHRDLLAILNRHVQTERAQTLVPPGVSAASRILFVGEDRLRAFESLHGRCGFDLRKILTICREMNDARNRDAWLSLAFLTRCLLDHVPPAFGRRTFAEVVSHEGGRTFKEACQSLDSMARKVADVHLHSPMREHDVLPNAQQTNASQGLDILLSEAITRLEERAAQLLISTNRPDSK